MRGKEASDAERSAAPRGSACAMIFTMMLREARRKDAQRKQGASGARSALRAGRQARLPRARCQYMRDSAGLLMLLIHARHARY